MVSRLPKITDSDVVSLTERIRNAVGGTGCGGVVIGLSGGIDSAVVAKLCADAIGPENVLCVFMPSRATPAGDYRITKELCDEWGVEYRILDVQPAVDSLTAILTATTDTRLDRGNIVARCRMIVLYNLARKHDRVVMGASNESEIMIGYFTKFGDGACDISPLSGIYKTQVRQMAKLIGIPEEIIKRRPSAGLWEGQTDEEDIGITYDALDPVLYAIASGHSDAEIHNATNVSEDMIAAIRSRVVANEHKRRLPVRP
ncbi:MAG: NAD+ synthase [Methanomassiliicoccaceae archaeon]|nr:NAD+ synthase [Methanomassiliicoccaceae archaeon]